MGGGVFQRRVPEIGSRRLHAPVMLSPFAVILRSPSLVILSEAKNLLLIEHLGEKQILRFAKNDKLCSV